ncbi:MAG: pilus assembly protein [Candidatus Berkiella sp.]
MNKALKLLAIPCLLHGSISQAALLGLTDTPLFLGTSVDPNVFFEVDDSGSMDWEVLTKPYWNVCAYDPHATGSFSSATTCGTTVDNSLIRSYGNNSFRHFSYIYNNSDNLYTDNCSNTDYNSIESCSAAGTKEWRVYSSDLNFTYYNPENTYIPWAGACLTNGTLCSNASFTAARSNPRQGTSGYSITKNLNGAIYHVWVDTRGYRASDGRPLRASAVNATNTPNGEVDLWDAHYFIKLNANNAEIRRVTYEPKTNTIGETNVLEATLTNTSACYNILGPSTLVRQIFNNTLGVTSTGADGCRTITETKQNFANWYQYSRKRSLAAKGAISTVINQYPNFRYGLSVINDYNALFHQVPASNVSNYTSHNAALLSNLYSYGWQALGTPLRNGLNRTGQYFDNTLSGYADPIIYSCQQNFTVLLTDGFWSENNPTGGPGDDDKDGISLTLADVAKYYYDKDLSPLPNNVIPSAADPATHQHMVTYTVAFGVSGLLVDTDGDKWPNPPLIESSNWGNPYNSDPEKIDDLWHAAYNSKGTFVKAQTPNALAAELGNALANITNRISSAATVAQNSTVLNTDSQVYQARFDSNQWRGELLAFAISPTGKLAQTPSWNADCKLTGGACILPLMDASSNPGISHTQRKIITRALNGNNQGAAFQWPSNYTNLKVSGSLPQRIADFLQYAPYNANTTTASEITANQTYGDKLVKYLRGNRADEQQNGSSYAFRNRQGLLGDIINSDPLFVGPPNRYYPSSLESASYDTFRTQYANRQKIVYTGSNDGMLHAFRADTGQEVLAYIPGDRRLYKNLSELSKTTYTHKFTVDGSPTEADVFINGSWRTILTGGLRKGGQTVYALDITDPAQFTEANANQIYLWEFSDENDADLGYIYGNVKIAKVRYNSTTTKWAAIFGNGYNNSENDGYASTTGKAALYILFIERGTDGTWTADTDYIKIPVGTGTPTTPNGLSEAYVVDIDGDYVADYIYAGDLKGTLWKFDLTSTTPTQWKSSATALFTAQQTTTGDQAITTAPIVGPHPTGLAQGVMVYFGTGKFLEKTDNISTGAVTQAFYGIWDKLDGNTVSKSQLLQQSILQEVDINVDTNGDNVTDTTTSVRQISDLPINWAAPTRSGDPAQHRGWYINLIVKGASSNHGERQISKALLRNNNVIFTTLLPSSSACDFGGSSWIMELNAASGGQPETTPFDLNNDGIFDSIDYIKVDNALVPVGGQKSSVGITPTPAVSLSGDKSKEIKILSGSMGLNTLTENPGTGPQGRQNWKQIME